MNDTNNSKHRHNRTIDQTKIQSHPLTKDEKLALLLVITVEECSEVIKAITKMQRFGIMSVSPKNGKTNAINLIEEAGDCLRNMVLLLGSLGFNEEAIKELIAVNMGKLKETHPNLFAPDADHSDTTAEVTPLQS